jgi:hypothetical protein
MGKGSLRERVKGQFWHWKAFPILGQKGQSVVNGDGSKAGVGEGERPAFLSPFTLDQAGLLRDFAREGVQLQTAQGRFGFCFLIPKSLSIAWAMSSGNSTRMRWRDMHLLQHGWPLGTLGLAIAARGAFRLPRRLGGSDGCAAGRSRLAVIQASVLGAGFVHL